ncbi:hypothetical protein [Geobacter hydrogenophilus]|uniref:hypothetical protein n=1 Tax=Geobacter hydrogenophilus TaxID=40983 RepID=UPI0024915EDB|nr:hypothetical protein [Geobacter hydrogenophilus]
MADIVAEEGSMPLTPTVSRAVIGHAPDVRMYIGTPEENTSRVDFPEAKLVWSLGAPDWDAAINAIPVDSTATRFKRRHDILPLRKEQITEYGDDDIFDKIVDLLEQEILSAQWVAVSDIKVQPDAWSPSATEFFEGVQRCCGKKTQDVMPFVIEWFKDNNKCDLWHRDYSEKTRFKVGGAEVLVGRPYIDLGLLETASCSAVVVVPHLSRRGPNGLWILSRGTQHPFIQKFNSCCAYYLAVEDRPDVVEEIDGWKSISSLEFFRLKKEAESLQQEMKDEHEIVCKIASATGSELLSLISCVDVVVTESGRYPIMHKGRLFEEEEGLVSVEEIAAVFTPLPAR